MNKQFKMLYVEITNRCNLDCPFCTPLALPKKEMSIAEFAEIVSKIKPYTNHLYLHIKGEPLSHTHFKAILDIASQNNIKINLTTNGTLLANHFDTTFNSPCIHRINISMQSFIAQTEKQKQRFLAGLKTFLLQHQQNPQFIVSLRLWNDTSSELVQKQNQLLLDYIMDTLSLTHLPIQENNKLGENLYLSQEPEFKWPNIDDEINPKLSACLGGKTQLGILADGTVVLCCLDVLGKTSLGNIFSSDLADILNSEAYLNAIKGFRDRKPYFELCQKCQYRNRFLE